MMAAYTVIEAAELLGVSDDTVAQLHLGDGSPIWAAVKATDLDVYPV